MRPTITKPADAGDYACATRRSGRAGKPAWPTNVVALYRCKLPEATCRIAAEVAKPILESGAPPDGRWYGR